MTGNYLNRILSLNAKHALYREDGKWYHNLTSFPGVLFDKSGYVIFESSIDYKSNPKLQIKKDLHIIGGIERLEQYRRFSLKEMRLIKGVNMSSKEEASREEETIRILREVDIILRKQVLVGKVKKIYENTCQICDVKIQVGFNKFYSEVHHIIPLGRPHNGKGRLDKYDLCLSQLSYFVRFSCN